MLNQQKPALGYSPKEIYKACHFLFTNLDSRWRYILVFENSKDELTVSDYIKKFGCCEFFMKNHIKNYSCFFRTLRENEFPKCLLAFIKKNYMRQDGPTLEYMIRKDYPDFTDYRIIYIHDLSHPQLREFSDWDTIKGNYTIEKETFSIASINDFFCDFFTPYWASEKVPILHTMSNKPITTQGVLKDVLKDLQKSGDDAYTYFYCEHVKNMNALKQAEAVERKTETVKLKLDVNSRTVYWQGEKRDSLSKKPFEILYILLRRTGEVVSFDVLGRSIESNNPPKVISKHINKTIKARIRPISACIEPITNIGYRCNLKPEEVEIEGEIKYIDQWLRENRLLNK